MTIAAILDGKPREIGDVHVRRVLPAIGHRHVGPFVFFDHMGPATFAPGAGMDVRPHPHIGLATVTYLFAGEILHRDSLGSHQPIRPGDINWMTAGRGIVHSERTSPELRAAGFALDGLQLWVALPLADEDVAPSFHHHPAATLPEVERDGARLRVLAGSAFGHTSPVRTCSPLFYVDAALAAGAALTVPTDHAERAAYVVDGAITCADTSATAGRMLVFTPGTEVVLQATAATRLVLLGGAPLDGPRLLWWNFVASSQARIDEAKRAWQAGEFGRVPGDDVEFIPLPA